MTTSQTMSAAKPGEAARSFSQCSLSSLPATTDQKNSSRGILDVADDFLDELKESGPVVQLGAVMGGTAARSGDI